MMVVPERKIKNLPAKPIVVYDGNCGFCHYWILRTAKVIGDRIDYQPYQVVAKDFSEIPEKEFSESVKFIDEKGNVYSGAAAFFKALSYRKTDSALIHLYRDNLFFRKASDLVYKTVSSHRNAAYKLTVALFGKNPSSPKKYWIVYLGLSVMLIAGLKKIKKHNVKLPQGLN